MKLRNVSVLLIINLIIISAFIGFGMWQYKLYKTNGTSYGLPPKCDFGMDMEIEKMEGIQNPGPYGGYCKAWLTPIFVALKV